MRILALDTATAATTVALSSSPGGPIVTREHIDARRHAEVLAPMVAGVLADAGCAPGDVDLLVCGVGPGPFTGLRVGIAFATSLGAVLARPVVGVCTHDAIAESVRERGVDLPFVVATRARRRESFAAGYDGDGTRAVGPLAHPDGEPFLPERPVAGDALEPGDPRAIRPRYPDAAAHIRLVRRRLEAGEEIPDAAGAAPGPEDVATGTGAAVAAVLLDRLRAGHWLLPPRPLYLRVPDAQPPGVPA